jgi:predicted nucleotidyltransferase
MDLELPNDFKEFLKLLRDHRVKYLLIGGYAVGFHGYTRATNDIDFWIAMDGENASRIVEGLKEFGFDVPELSADLFLKPNQIVRMGLEPVRIEVTTTIDGVDFEDCYARRVQTDLDGVPVSVIALEDLKTNKRASGRTKDLADLEELSKMVKAGDR